MPKEEFDRHKTALSVRRQEKPKQLSHRASRYWGEITSGEYFFNRDDVEVEQLQKISHDDLLAFFHYFIFNNGEKRRKIAVHVLSNVPQEKSEPAQNGLQPAPHCKQTQIVDDIAVFKSSLPLYPLVKPWTNHLSTAAKAKL